MQQGPIPVEPGGPAGTNLTKSTPKKIREAVQGVQSHAQTFGNQAMRTLLEPALLGPIEFYHGMEWTNATTMLLGTLLGSPNRVTIHP